MRLHFDANQRTCDSSLLVSDLTLTSSSVPHPSLTIIIIGSQQMIPTLRMTLFDLVPVEKCVSSF